MIFCTNSDEHVSAAEGTAQKKGAALCTAANPENFCATISVQFLLAQNLLLKLFDALFGKGFSYVVLLGSQSISRRDR